MYQAIRRVCVRWWWSLREQLLMRLALLFTVFGGGSLLVSALFGVPVEISVGAAAVTANTVIAVDRYVRRARRSRRWTPPLPT